MFASTCLDFCVLGFLWSFWSSKCSLACPRCWLLHFLLCLFFLFLNVFVTILFLLFGGLFCFCMCWRLLVVLARAVLVQIRLLSALCVLLFCCVCFGDLEYVMKLEVSVVFCSVRRVCLIAYIFHVCIGSSFWLYTELFMMPVFSSSWSLCSSCSVVIFSSVLF